MARNVRELCGMKLQCWAGAYCGRTYAKVKKFIVQPTKGNGRRKSNGKILFIFKKVLFLYFY